MIKVFKKIFKPFGKIRLPKMPRWMYRSMLRVEKRLRFVLSTLIMTGIMLLSTFFFFDKAFIFIPLLVIASIALTYFSILEGLEGIEWFTLFVMGVFFTVSTYLFYYLFPGRWLTRIPAIAVYAASTYAILLTSNIFNVGVEKNLQLYRAAFSVNYFYQTVVGFLAFNILFSLRENFLINGIGVGLIAFPLALQFLWTIKLNLSLEKQIVTFALFISIVLGEIAIVFSFVPFDTTVFALLMTAAYYSLVGLSYSYLDSRLFKETVREYLIVLIIVFVIGFFTLRW